MKTEIIIVGAGFAGLLAARELGKLVRQQSGVTVRLFDKNAYTTMIPCLPDLAGGRYDGRYIRESVEKRIPSSIIFHQECVTGIDLHAKTIQTGRAEYVFDYLIMAGGSTAQFPDFEQRRDFIYTLDGFDDANRIRHDFSQYLARCQQPTVVMVGGGYTGMELAGNLQFAGRAYRSQPRICVVEMKPWILPLMPQWAREYIRQQAELRGFEVMTNVKVDVFDAKNVTLSDGRQIKDVFFCCATGTSNALSIRNQPKSIDDGRLIVDECLMIPDYPGVFAAGDTAAIQSNGAYLRKAVNFARDSGRQAGRNVALSVLGKSLEPFRPIDPGWVIPFCDIGAGMLFTKYAVRGRIPLCLHYFMCGLRNYSFRNSTFFAAQAVAALLKFKTA